MKMTILGSGTSHGVPVVGCSCAVCRSTDPKNSRSRSSAWITKGNLSLLIDTSTDFRSQALREGIDRLDAVIYTHPHADHLHGLDDTRSLTWSQPIALYASEPTEAEIRERFSCVFRETQKGGGKPDVFFVRIGEGPFTIGPLEVVPIPVYHGELPILGFRFGELAYITDCSMIPESSFRLLEGTRLLVLGALRDRPHATHYSVAEAIDAARRIGVERTWFTHLCHDLEHRELAGRLPEGMEPAYDGLTIEL